MRVTAEQFRAAKQASRLKAAESRRTLEEADDHARLMDSIAASIGAGHD